MNKKKAVVLIGLRNEESKICCALAYSRGYKVILINKKITMDEALTVDIPIEIDMNLEAEIINKLHKLERNFDICAVCTTNNFRVTLVCKISEYFGLTHTLSHEASINCENKRLTRQILNAENISPVKFGSAKNTEDALALSQHITYPLIVKPSNDSGGRLVTLCNSDDELISAVESIRKHAFNYAGKAIDEDILIEEYLQGSEYSIESVTIGNQTTIIAITEKKNAYAPYAIETGHLVPAPLESEVEKKIKTTVTEALNALRVENCVCHTEIIVTESGPKIVEVNARVGGDKISYLVKAVTGYDLKELALHIALGGSLKDAPRHNPVARSSAIRFLIAHKQGTLKMNESALTKYDSQISSSDMYVKNGSFVEHTKDNFGRLGYFIVHSNSGRSASTVADEIESELKISVC